MTNSNPTTEFVYDGDGGRVLKIVTGNQQPVTRTTYVGSLYEIDDGAVRKHVFAGANRVCTIEPEHTYYSHGDHLGSSNVITDENGEQVSLTEYTPYGTVSEQSGSYDYTYKFTGKELDASTGLYYYGARYYDHEIGRFISPDSIVQAPFDPQTLNRYAYCRNNPVKYVDPTGHFFGIIAAIISIVKAAAAFAAAHPIITGAVLGAIQGGINSYQADTNIFEGIGKGLAFGALTGGVLGCMGQASLLKLMIGGSFLGGVGSAMYGGDVGEGFLYGAAGGALIWAGGSIMAQEFFGAGLLGNSVSSAGISAIENVAAGQEWDSSYTVFFGPLSVTLSEGMKPKFGLASISSAYALAKNILGPNKFNLWETISSGTPVFNRVEAYGRTRANVIEIRKAEMREVGIHLQGTVKQSVMGHERVHALIQHRMTSAIANIYGYNIGSDIDFLVSESAYEAGIYNTAPYTVTGEKFASSFGLWGE